MLAALALLAPAPAAAQSGPTPSDLSGVWDLAISDPDAGDRTGRLTIDETDGILSGRIEWDDGAGLAVSGWRAGEDIDLRIASFTGVPLLLSGRTSPQGREMSGSVGIEGAWFAVWDAPSPETTLAGPSGGATPTGETDPTAGDPSRAIGSDPPDGPDPTDVQTPDPGATPGALPPVVSRRGGPDGRVLTTPTDPASARPRIDAPDLEGGVEQALTNFADATASGTPLESAAEGFASDAVEAAAQEAGRRAADAASDLASDAVARGVGGATTGAVGAGLREALNLSGATDATPIEAASQALADAAIGIAASEARQEVAEAASDVLKDEVADRVGQAAGGVLGQTLGNAVDGAGLLGGLFGRGDDDPEEGGGPAPGTLSGRWRFVVLESRGDGVVTHTGILDLSEKGEDVEATARWSGAAPAILAGGALQGTRDGLRLSFRTSGSGPVLRGVVDAGGRRMGGYVSAGGFVGLWQASR